MECPYCKTENRNDGRYCSSCGNLIDAASTSKTLPSSGNSGSMYSLTPGLRLQGGRYIIKQVLGQGGMGAALLATDIRLDNKAVVIKELISDNVDPGKRQDDVRNFRREVSTVAHIDHPLVPNVTDHFQEGERYFMVQEYVEGENLEQRLERTNQPMKEREVLICASEMLDVLDYLAQQTPPIVHRDIKPANIIISTRDKRAHLVDFGIARADEFSNSRRKQTAALGTPGYAPPEQYQGNADPRSDLYALAATLHHVLTNRDPRNYPPFSYPPARALNPQLSSEIEGVLTRALTNDINQRYQSAAAFKQDIDTILRQRFGISGNIDSYTLGTSGNSAAMAALDPYMLTHNTMSMNQPTQLSNSGHGLSSQTPVQPLLQQSLPPNATPSYPLYPLPLMPQSRKKRRGPIWIMVILLLLVLIAGGIGGYFVFLRPTPPNLTGIGVTQVGHNEAIGISDGTFAFDTTLDDGSLKTQAAQLLKQNSNNVNPVISLLNQGVGKSANDAESQIYEEDLRVLESGKPYVTVVVATMITGDASIIRLGRDDLQGAYVAQQEFNEGAKLHGGTQVRLLIANSGSQADYATQVAQQIVQLAQADKTFVGVMGWPYSDRTLNAVKVLGKAHIPLISQTASADFLTRSSAYFFRVVPSNKVQGVRGATYARQSLNTARVALFYDDQNLYSQSLAQDFSASFKADGGQVVVEEKYTVGKAETLPAALTDALSHQPDLIYFSGYSADLGTLLTDLPAGNNIAIMGGDALYELGGYSASTRSGFTHLRFTAFSYPDEWEVLGYSAQKPGFFDAYTRDFNANGQAPGGSYGFTRADNDAMLSYDATIALLTGCDIALSSGKQNITPADLQQGLLKVNGTHTVQGVSGQIAFGPDGDPLDKAIVVLSVDSDGHIHMESTITGTFLK